MHASRFDNKVVVVTGAAFGIGKNIARLFGQEGAHVVIADCNAKVGQAVVAEFRRGDIVADFIRVDLSKKGSAAFLIKHVVQNGGRLDVLVNNASSGERKTLDEETVANFKSSLAVNLEAPFFLSQAAVLAMAKTGGGAIVNISSVAASLTCHQAPNYHLAKAGLLQMTRYLAAFAGPSQVRVNAVSPGFIVRDEDQARYHQRDNASYRLTAEFCHPIGTVGTADDVARAVLFLSSDEARFITGQNLTVDGGLTLQEQSGLVFRFAKQKKAMKT